MSEFEKQKLNLVEQIKSLCAHCANHVDHVCRVENITEEIKKLSGVPLIVNDEFSGILFNK